MDHLPTKPHQLAGLFIILLVSWLLWSGLYKPLLIGLGIFSCLLSLWLGTRMGFFRHATDALTHMRSFVDEIAAESDGG